ncbi:hypothetical protein RRG08_043370 [Elysia crispata]|uniref:Uncharacterized protein n=1 Tax=Elysia crispata TaxID=231223 RepID=A0AAE0Z5D9_9GAST|nr:hypothetical protein RRG08_043370 [Elysia crispata]
MNQGPSGWDIGKRHHEIVQVVLRMSYIGRINFAYGWSIEAQTIGQFTAPWRHPHSISPGNASLLCLQVWIKM